MCVVCCTFLHVQLTRCALTERLYASNKFGHINTNGTLSVFGKICTKTHCYLEEIKDKLSFSVL